MEKNGWQIIGVSELSPISIKINKIVTWEDKN